MAQKQFLDLTGLSTFKDLMTQYIGTEDAKSIRSMSISGNTVNFYRSTDATGTVAYTITLPDTSGLIPKIEYADGGYLVESTSSGDVSETGYTIDALMGNINARMDKIIQPVGGKLVISNINGGVTETDTAISALATNAYVGSIPAGASSTTVVDYISEAIEDKADIDPNITGYSVLYWDAENHRIAPTSIGYGEFEDAVAATTGFDGDNTIAGTIDGLSDAIDDLMPKGTNWLTGYIVGTSSDGTVYMGETGLGAIEDAVAALHGFSDQHTVADALDDKIDVISNATGGKIATTTSGGEVAESSTAISDLATNTFVGSIPSGATSTNVVDYISEAIDDATGDFISFDTNTTGYIPIISPDGSTIGFGNGLFYESVVDSVAATDGFDGDNTIADAIDAINDTIDGFSNVYMPLGNSWDGYRVAVTNSDGTVSETDIVAENVVTGYFYDGDKIGRIVAVGNDDNGLAATGYTINDLATKAYVGTIPSGASSSNVVAYVGEMTGSISNAQIDALFSAS